MVGGIKVKNSEWMSRLDILNVCKYFVLQNGKGSEFIDLE